MKKIRYSIKPDVSYPCPGCADSYFTKMDLRRHVKTCEGFLYMEAFYEKKFKLVFLKPK